MVVLPWQSPERRALATLRRQLILDAVAVAIFAIGSIPLDGPVPWRAIAIGAAGMLAKSLMTTIAKYDRARQNEDSTPLLSEVE